MEGTCRNLCLPADVRHVNFKNFFSWIFLCAWPTNLLFPDFFIFIRYKQAAFCYEELILAQPTNPLYHLAYADVSTTAALQCLLVEVLYNFT